MANDDETIIGSPIVYNLEDLLRPRYTARDTVSRMFTGYVDSMAASYLADTTTVGSSGPRGHLGDRGDCTYEGTPPSLEALRNTVTKMRSTCQKNTCDTCPLSERGVCAISKLREAQHSVSGIPEVDFMREFCRTQRSCGDCPIRYGNTLECIYAYLAPDEVAPLSPDHPPIIVTAYKGR